ncbi:MAG: deoxyribodipyrimidine photo-lyase [Gammaproteobacteria bacterium]|nr:MAG: deoxyribodipyrimidine photo-lyase [Gammaproteobacteria bacterium]
MKLVWFRNDLRSRDNPALFHACRDAGDRGVTAVAAICPRQWQQHDEAPIRVQFWLANLRSLRGELAALNIPLKLVYPGTFDRVPEELLALAQRLGCDGLYLNREYCLNENRRDKRVVDAFREVAIPVYGFHGDVVLAPAEVMNGQGDPYRVFTPFSRAWRRGYLERYPQPLPIPERQRGERGGEADPLPDQVDYPDWDNPHWSHELWPAGAETAHQKLREFVTEKVADYDSRRDVPAAEGTSALSPYLSCGVLSPRQCLAALREHAATDDWLDQQWTTEIIWREFYRHLMTHYSALSRWEPFRPEVESRIRWQDNDHYFQAWCRGETGFPIVDAGMKQLLATGWMHNRVRMIVASFLTKLLRQDWRHGARFFMRHLIDGDFASNLGGWQWSASVGADAAPYFRIFNPTRQAERFDPRGEYVARWLPELAELNGMQRHDPAAAAQVGRPAPIIDYARARADSLADYKARG